MGHKGKLKKRYKSLKKRMHELERRQEGSGEEGKEAIELDVPKRVNLDKHGLFYVKERQLILFFIHILYSDLNGEAEYDEAKSKYISSMPFSEEYLSRKYSSGIPSAGQSVFEKHFSLLRGQASKEVNRELDLLKTKDDGKRVKHFELTEDGFKYARFNRDTIDFVLEVFNKTGIKIAVKTGK